MLSFGNGFGRNVVIFGIDNTSSSHTDNQKNKFLVIGGGTTKSLDYSISTVEKEISINFSKSNTKFCLSLHQNSDESYLYVNEKEVSKFKTNDNISWYHFSGSPSKDFTK